MVTMYPIIVSLGVSKLAATSMIGITACLDLGPASGNAILAAEIPQISAANYFINYQLPVAVITMIVIAVSIYYVNVRMDKKYGLYLIDHSDEDSTSEYRKELPKIYFILPLIPLFLILLFSEYIFSEIKMNVVSAMLISMFIAMIFELFRTKNLKNTLQSIEVFFKGMGSQYASVVTLIVSGKVFALGLDKLGFIDSIIQAGQNASLGAVPMTILMVLFISLAAVVMGREMLHFSPFLL